MFAHSDLVFNNSLLREAIEGGGGNAMLTTVLVVIYATIIALLSIYGGHRYSVLFRWFRSRHRQPEPVRQFAEHELPGITVQLPLFNELYVVDRLLESVAALDYPKDRMQIQVLDDSTDETVQLAEAAVARLAAKGFDIVYIHRVDRTGFKAGALDNGLRSAKYDLIAIFDADFRPEPPFLREIVHYFADEKVGVAQARWGHMNEGQSLLTRTQALMLNGHFLLEHPSRNRTGLFFNFNGTGGMWRRQAIDDAGGWEHDTLTEDLDLSFRAQMKGWKFIYNPDIVCPAELPVEMNAFKSQQHRWAKGSIQVMLKILPTVLRAPLSFRQKMEAFLQLTSNLAYLLIIPMCLMTLPMLVLRARIADGTLGSIIDAVVFLCATGSMLTFYGITHLVGSSRKVRDLHTVPFLMALGIGMAVNQAKAVFEAVIRRETPFVRTPKFNLDQSSKGAQWKAKRYKGAITWVPIAEMAFAMYFTGIFVYALTLGMWGTLPFLLLFLIGFWYVAGLSLAQRLAGRVRATAPRPVPSSAS